MRRRWRPEVDDFEQLVAAMGIGLGVGVVTIIAAFFQQPIVVVLRWIWRVLGVTATDGAPAAGRWLVRPGGASPANRFTCVATALGAAAGRGAHRIGHAIAGLSRQVLTGLPHRAALSPAPPFDSMARLDLDGVGSPKFGSDAGTTSGSTPEVRDETGFELTVSHRRQFTPATRVHLEEAVRAFLEARGGVAPLEVLVRHLDLRFGGGLGFGLIESLRRRGVLELKRQPDRPTRMVVALVPQPPGTPTLAR
jgi:hypothetical protein